MWTAAGRRLLRAEVARTLQWKSASASTNVRSAAVYSVAVSGGYIPLRRRLFSLLNECLNRTSFRVKLRKTFVPSLSAGLWGVTTTAKMSVTEATQRCDELYDAGKIVEAHEAIMEVENDPSPEVQWRVVRMKFKLAEKNGTPDDVSKAILDGVPKLRANLEKSPNCPNTHKWIAILLGSKQKHPSFKEQIEEAFLIRSHLEKAIELNPKDGYAHYILGKWCYQVASVSWYQKKIAATLFASPPESSYEIALEHFKDAEQLKPDIFTMCFLMAAQCLLNTGKKDEAAVYLKKCVDQETRDADSKRNAEEARKLAKKHSIKL